MSVLDSLRQKAREWAQSVVELHNTPVPADLESEKRELLNRAKTVKNAIEKVFGTLEELKPIAQIQELGAVPILVPAAVIAAASAAIGAWYLSYKKFKKKLEGYNTLRHSGLTHEQALSVIGKDENVFQSAKNLLIPVALIGGAYLLLR